MKKNRSGKIAVLVVAVLLFISVSSSAFVLFSIMIPYAGGEFVNVMPLIKTGDAVTYPGVTITYPGEDITFDISENSSADTSSAASTELPELSKDPAAEDDNSFKPTEPTVTETSGKSPSASAPAGQSTANPQFRMEAEAEIFKFSYDNESGKTTVIGVEGNDDKLIAPGTSNLYQFTLSNPGNVALDYTLTMEAWVTGTELRIPVIVRLWDYTNKYIVGSSDGMVDVMELNTVEEKAELAAGRYAVYTLEWEWPFEWGDDEYDTMLGDLAAFGEEDLVLHIVIRTVAEYDDEPDDPDAGETTPPKTGDKAPLVLLILLCIGSFIGLLAMFIAFIKSGRKEKRAKSGIE